MVERELTVGLAARASSNRGESYPSNEGPGDDSTVRPGGEPLTLARGTPAGNSRAGSAIGERRLFSLHVEGMERLPFQELVQSFEDELLRWAMERAGGQQSLAAELLGLPRTTLQSKLLKRAGMPGAGEPRREG